MADNISIALLAGLNKASKANIEAEIKALQARLKPLNLNVVSKPYQTGVNNAGKATDNFAGKVKTASKETQVFGQSMLDAGNFLPHCIAIYNSNLVNLEN